MADRANKIAIVIVSCITATGTIYHSSILIVIAGGTVGCSHCARIAIDTTWLAVVGSICKLSKGCIASTITHVGIVYVVDICSCGGAIECLKGKVGKG